MVASRDGGIHVQARAQETDVGQLVAVSLTSLEGVELLAQSELNDAVRNQVQPAPNPLSKNPRGISMMTLRVWVA